MRWRHQRQMTTFAGAVYGTLLFSSISIQQTAGSIHHASGKVMHPGHRDEERSWSGLEESDTVDPTAAILWGNHILRSRPKDLRAMAIAELDELANSTGFPADETLFLLGKAYDEGREELDINRDRVMARDLYAHAAKKGHPASQHALAVVLASSGDAASEVEAILYDYFASLGGNAPAHAAMGYRYLHGIGTVQNCTQSYRHYEAAAREVIRDLYSPGRGGIGRPLDHTRLAERFVSGTRPLSDYDAERAEYWMSSALTGNVMSQRTMGILHHLGTSGVDQDLPRAFEYFMEASEVDAYSKSMAADMLMRGAGVEPNYERAFEIFTETKTEVVSLNGLGYLHYHGLAAPEDILLAYKYFMEALGKDTDHPNADTLFNLGMILKGDKLVDERGKPVIILARLDNKDFQLEKDHGKASDFFKLAAKLGHIEAAFQAAQLEGSKAHSGSSSFALQNCQQAVRLLKKVTERGPWMRDMHRAVGRITAGDNEGALVLYSRLAEMGVELAQSNAAWLLESKACETFKSTLVDSAGTNGTSPAVLCQKRALRMYEHAARQGRAGAEVKVGDFHYYGKGGLPVDYEKAARRYLKASEAKHSEGSFSMGLMHQMGHGVPQDLFLAKRYFDNAAEYDPEAIPVARVALLSLRVQATFRRWRGWWRGLWARAEGQEGQEGQGGQDAQIEDRSEEVPKLTGDVLSPTESYVLVGLIASLVLVLLERKRREQRRRAEDAAAEVAG